MERKFSSLSWLRFRKSSKPWWLQWKYRFYYLKNLVHFFVFFFVGRNGSLLQDMAFQNEPATQTPRFTIMKYLIDFLVPFAKMKMLPHLGFTLFIRVCLISRLPPAASSRSRRWVYWWSHAWESMKGWVEKWWLKMLNTEGYLCLRHRQNIWAHAEPWHAVKN